MSEENLKAIYYNPKHGFLSLAKLWQRVKKSKSHFLTMMCENGLNNIKYMP